MDRKWPTEEKLDMMIEVEEQVAKHGATGDRVEIMIMLRDMAPELLRMARWALDAADDIARECGKPDYTTPEGMVRRLRATLAKKPWEDPR